MPALIEAAIRRQPKTRFDRAHFAGFGEYALNFEAVYMVLDSEYNTFMNIQQAINLELMEELARPRDRARLSDDPAVHGEPGRHRRERLKAPTLRNTAVHKPGPSVH